MKKNIKIAHIHVWDKKNKGDVAIVLAVQEQLRIAFPGCQISDFPMEVLRAGKPSDVRRINTNDIAVIGGGGILYRYFLPFSRPVIKGIKLPIVLFSVGYIREVGSRGLNKKELESIKALAGKARLIGARDYYTKRFLAGNDISQEKIFLIGDSAILLTEKRNNKNSIDNKINIGLNLNYSGWLGFGKWHKEIINSYNEVGNYFSKIQNAGIFYLKHHPDEKNILKELDIPDMKIVDISPREQKYFYSKLDLVVGMMLHSCVMTFGAGTPEINVAYDIRNKNFAKFIGCPELAFRLEDLQPGKLLKRAKQVFLRKEQYEKKFAVRIKNIRKKHAEFINYLINIV